ncbi:MAG TPA: uracil-DNA glycosylase family protein [Flavisolibacter sp.]|nr:uracil-DNA glycosylase family protein [Flavisolibacter sp.]
MKSWAQLLYEFYTSLRPAKTLPNGVQWLYPQQNEEVLSIVRQFLYKYFDDNSKRTLMLGINPGRFGAGVTGINFTSPKQLTEVCGIKHPYRMQTELSADFIYAMIDAYGGAAKFYKDVFIGSVCPLGFVKDGKNINYYDDKELEQAVEPFIIKHIETLLSFPVDRTKCLCLGGEKNYKYLSRLNERYGWFDEIIPLPHPRFIMQYRRKAVQPFIQQYLDALKKK